MEILFGLLGLGGFAREVMPFAIRSVEDQYPGALVTAYFVDASPTLSFQNGTPITSDNQFLKIPCDERLFNVAISDSEIREKLANEYIGAGAKPITLRAISSSCENASEIGTGAIFCGNSMVTPDVRIGRFFHSNMYSYVAHDCIIGDYVTFAPRVSCNGNVHIHDHAYIGTGAVLKQGTPEQPLVIGAGAVVGMGAVVTKSVPPQVTVVGNPARILERA